MIRSTADKTPRRADSHNRCCSVEPSATPMVSCPPLTSGEGSPAASLLFSSEDDRGAGKSDKPPKTSFNFFA
nr:hypothetical protein [uncultured Neisseria sp.]